MFFRCLEYTDLYGHSLSSCRITRVAAAACCNLVFLLSGAGSSPEESPGLWHADLLAWSIRAIILTFFLLFVSCFQTCISVHTSFISILVFSLSSLNVSMTAKYGRETAWTIQTVKHFRHAQMMLYPLFRFLHGTHCIHRC